MPASMSTALRLWLAVLVLGCSKNAREEVPVIAELPEFALVDQDARAFDRHALEGHTWVVSFVFTHCRTTCLRLIEQMKKLQSSLSDAPGVHFLSVSVDPRNDTPSTIKAYIVESGIDESNWRFVTGDEQAVEDFVLDGFKVGYGRTRWSTELIHSSSFALVDREARIRGYYASDDAGLRMLERDLRNF
jgi:protein SCO1/2